MINNFLYQKNNLIVSSIAIIVTIIFVSLDKFSFFSILIGLTSLLFIYLYQFKNNKEFISYVLVFVFSYICFYLYQINFFNNQLSIIVLSICSSLIFFILFFSKDYKIDVRYLYSIIILLSLSQIANIIIILQSSIIAKALFITLIFYFISGIIGLYKENKLSFNSIIKYSIVFSVGVFIVSLNLNHLI